MGLVLLALYLVGNALFLSIAVGRDQWLRSILTLWRNLSTHDDLSHGLTLSLERDAARISRQMIHRGFVGIDPGYAERELDADRAANGASNFTREPASGLAPASAYANLVVAHQPTDWAPQYHGTECQSLYPRPDCPFPGLCAPAAEGRASDQPCVVWRSGTPASLARAKGIEELASRDHTLDFDSPGRWREDDLWHPYGSTMQHNEGYAFFTPEDVQRCFMGKRVMFSGDSTIRQLFYRVVNYLRGIPTNAEHLFNWGTASYIAFSDGTDQFIPVCPNRECEIPSNAQYSILFDWHDHRNYTWNVHRIRELRADIVLQGIVYWRGCYEDPAEWRDALDALFSEGWQGQYTWYHTPEKRHSNYREFYWRNRRMRRWIREHRERGNERVNGIPGDALARLYNGREIVRDRRPIESSYDDVHFMATFLEADYPKPIKAGLQYVKTPLDWDTRDMFNFNLMQLWLNGICRPTT
ncbi:hypothetical protein EXIGLDRAFT_727940 [Exidia glandulosa HHB12029]|uniref:Uncharacterized protein n=1 Tax=Exidia glandulosa HHB12029 TaxID=1314781 RepID=A0A165D565_EXIGL|nr:hypothetical protein EXIGLDRAFT_727940 [Exidia glandulosa HHB12029]